MQSKLFQDLEFNKVTDHIVKGCHSIAGREIAAQLHPLDKIAVITSRLNLLQEIQNALKHNHALDFSDLLPLEELFTDTKQVAYGYDEFRLAYLNARLAQDIFERRNELEGYPELNKLLKKIVSLKEICREFEQIFDADGEVKDNASEELKRIRRRKILLREQIIRSLQKKFTDAAFEHALQEKFVTQRDGRYVVPVKEAAVSQVKGIVQGHSGSRQTVFMEPEDVVGINNDLQLLQQEEKREIFRIFQAFTEMIRAQQNPLQQNYRVLSEADCWFSCGRLGRKLDSSVPVITEQPFLKIKRGRHPLLILQKDDIKQVIPFELSLGESFGFLVLSGPNTGGKTVLLKAAGLLTLMALTGLPIPADIGTEIGLFENVAADIGDEQSIENALSTFPPMLLRSRTS